jgi:hypothetical protein
MVIEDLTSTIERDRSFEKAAEFLCAGGQLEKLGGRRMS